MIRGFSDDCHGASAGPARPAEALALAGAADVCTYARVLDMARKIEAANAASPAVIPIDLSNRRRVFGSAVADVETEPLMGPPTTDDAVLHIVLQSSYPIALCGFRVSDEFNPSRSDTAGRDRCASCLRIASARGLTR